MKEEKLMINLTKCSLMQEEIVYFGFMISADGFKMDSKKVKEILEWPTLENVGEVRSFHGLDSFYRKLKEILVMFVMLRLRL